MRGRDDVAVGDVRNRSRGSGLAQGTAAVNDAGAHRTAEEVTDGFERKKTVVKRRKNTREDSRKSEQIGATITGPRCRSYKRKNVD